MKAKSPRLTTRLLLPVLLFAALPFFGAARLAAADDRPARPNILFLFSDDQRADAVGAYDNPHIQTPNLDRLVNQGFGFRRAYCMGSMHGAVCQPSRAMLNSGRSLYRVPMDLQGVKILPQALREAGYNTFGTGKWHNGRGSFARGFTDGKAVFFGGMSNHREVPVVDLKPDGAFSERRIGKKFSSEMFADAAADFIRYYRGNRPFYAYVSFTAPHDPRMPPLEVLNQYQPAELPLPANFMPQHPFHNGWMTGRDESLAPWPRTEEVIRNQLAEYYGMITHMDAQIGRVLRALAESGRAKNTIIIFSSDHGLALGSHGLLGKQNLYEHSMRAPLVFAGPGIPQGEESHALVYLYDIYPTVCGLAGVELPDGVEGSDLQPIWSGEKQAVRESLFTAYEDVQRAVRDDRWKLIRYPKIDKTQLFDLQNDPHELKDLSGQREYAQHVTRMLSLLTDWQKKANDRAPLYVANPLPSRINLTGRKRTPDRHQPERIVRKYFGDQ